MKRFKQGLSMAFLVLVVSAVLSCMTACSAPDERTSDTSQEESAPHITFDGSSYTAIGDGNFFVQGTDGTSSDEARPVIVISKNAVSTEIYFEADGYTEQPKTYFFVDGKHVAENNIPTKTQGTLSLDESLTTVGVHKVELVQFSGDDVNGKVVSYQSAEFEIQLEQA